jgi:DNA-binding transcriptional LysR family regulator
LQNCNHGDMSRQPLPISPLRFDELAVFVQVAEAGSIAAAARRLGVPKSTVGRAIARLERDFGVALVRRMAQGPCLTEPGEQLAGLASPHVAALRDVSAALSQEASEAYGTLRVTAPSDLGTLFLGPLLASFLQRYPRMTIDLDHSLRLVDLIGEGFDLAIRVLARPMPSSTLVARKLARLDLGLYAAATYLLRHEAPRRPDSLAQHAHVFYQRLAPKNILSLEGPAGRVQVPVSARLGVNDFFFVRESVVHGAGIGALPWYVANAEVAAGRLVRVLPEYRLAGTTAYLVYPRVRPLPSKLAVFRAFLLEHAHRLLIEPGAAEPGRG